MVTTDGDVVREMGEAQDELRLLLETLAGPIPGVPAIADMLEVERYCHEHPDDPEGTRNLARQYGMFVTVNGEDRLLGKIPHSWLRKREDGLLMAGVDVDHWRGRMEGLDEADENGEAPAIYDVDHARDFLSHLFGDFKVVAD